MASVETYIILGREEVQRKIPYALICETRYGGVWETTHRKRRWSEEFSEREREVARRLFGLALRWTLVSGVPEEVKMTTKTFVLWMKLGEFCYSL